MTADNRVRIIGGKWRGLKVVFPDKASLRPTHDRIRETLFNWLQTYIVDATCLDLFAGSGVIGFEALSRGAKSTLFIDEDPSVVAALRASAKKLATRDATIMQATIPNNLIKLNYPPFDIIFLDPPYNEGLIELSLEWLQKNNCYKKGSLIYIECEVDYDLKVVLQPGMQIEKVKRTKTVAFYLVRVELV